MIYWLSLLSFVSRACFEWMFSNALLPNMVGCMANPHWRVCRLFSKFPVGVVVEMEEAAFNNIMRFLNVEE